MRFIHPSDSASRRVRSSKRQPVTRFTPRLEALEDRLALSTLVVGKSGHAEFSTIQSAVDAAKPGDTIDVQPGTYVEQVLIPAGKDRIELESEKRLAAIIQAPPIVTGDGAIVEVKGAHDVSIEGFTITGGPVGEATLQFGVDVEGGGSATIDGNHITHIETGGLQGLQTGVGIVVGRENPPAGEVASARATIVDNTIDNYQKEGINVEGAGSYAAITDNDVTGAGPTPVIAQNGIEITGGATGVVKENEVSRNQYTGTDTQGAGILLNGAGDRVQVWDNRVFQNDGGIALVDVARADVEYNHIRDSTFDGIDLLGKTRDSVIAHNNSSHNGMDGIYAEGSHNTIADNHTNHNGEDGIQLNGATNTLVTENDSDYNARYGISVLGASSGNVIRKNDARGNGVANYFDGTSGGHNTWSDNDSD